jgi:DHA1 family bicyclomycin/chloramphenicol resistance-like MFS transporter
MNRRFLHMALVLGLITAVGPFAIDMYLPALPSIGQTLHASPAAVQMSLMAFFITIGVCQLAYGPLTDIIGRKAPIYGGLIIFVIGSIGCALAPTIEVLIGFRVVQAFGACAGMVVPRAIVRDLHTGPDATRLMSLLMLVMSVSPILAPLTGSLIISAFGWPGVFWAVTVAAAVGLVLTATQLKETRPPADRVGSSWRGAAAAYLRLAVDPAFMSLTLVGAFGISAFFVYLANSSFVLIDHYGLTPAQFSLCFSLNAASFFGFSQFTGRLTERHGLPNVVRVAAAGFAASTALLAALTAAGMDSLPLIMALLFLGYGFLGLVLPTTAVLALNDHGDIAGTASALMGSVQMVVGAAVMAVVGLFANGLALPMVTGIAACAVTAFVIAQAALAPRPGKVAVQAE